jgi:hypothetical protein
MIDEVPAAVKEKAPIVFPPFSCARAKEGEGAGSCAGEREEKNTRGAKVHQ